MVIIVGIGWLVIGVAVLVTALVQTVRLLRASRGVRAAAAFGLFLWWTLLTLVAGFFLRMFGLGSLAAAGHARQAPAADDAGLQWLLGLVVGYPLAGLLVLGLLLWLGRAVRMPLDQRGTRG